MLPFLTRLRARTSGAILARWEDERHRSPAATSEGRRLLATAPTESGRSPQASSSCRPSPGPVVRDVERQDPRTQRARRATNATPANPAAASATKVSFSRLFRHAIEVRGVAYHLTSGRGYIARLAIAQGEFANAPNVQREANRVIDDFLDRYRSARRSRSQEAVLQRRPKFRRKCRLTRRADPARPDSADVPAFGAARRYPGTKSRSVREASSADSPDGSGDLPVSEVGEFKAVRSPCPHMQ